MAPKTMDVLLPDYIRYAFQFMVLIGGFVCIGVFSYAGVKMVISAGIPMARKDAKEQILAAVLGMVVLFGSYVISKEIDPKLVSTVPGIKAAGGITIFSAMRA